MLSHVFIKLVSNYFYNYVLHNTKKKVMYILEFCIQIRKNYLFIAKSNMSSL